MALRALAGERRILLQDNLPQKTSPVQRVASNGQKQFIEGAFSASINFAVVGPKGYQLAASECERGVGAVDPLRPRATSRERGYTLPVLTPSPTK